MCTLPFWTSIAPRACGPVRMGALERLCSRGLFQFNEGVGEAESQAAFFAFFYLAFVQCFSISNISEKNVLTYQI